MTDRPAARSGTPTWAKVLAGCCLVALGLAVMFLVGVCTLVDTARSARVRAYELTAVNHLRAYVRGQEEYRALKGRYAPKMMQLVSDKGAGGEKLELIPFGLAATGEGSRAEYGAYRFREVKTIAGRPVDWQKQFGLSAVPAGKVEGVAGTRAFIVDQSGAIWSRSCSEGAGFVEDFPADPAAAGWTSVGTAGEH